MAFDMYLKISGPDLKGESTRKGFEDQIEVFSFNFGVENHISFMAGGGASVGKAVPSDLSIVAKYSMASAPLFVALASGQAYDYAELSLVRTSGGSTDQAFLVHRLSDVYVTEYQTSGTEGADDAPSDSVSFTFGAIQTDYYGQNASGQRVHLGHASWDFLANKAS